jgi:hypothetical protein
MTDNNDGGWRMTIMMITRSEDNNDGNGDQWGDRQRRTTERTTPERTTTRGISGDRWRKEAIHLHL